MKVKDIFEKLVRTARGYSHIYSARLRKTPHGTPGELVAALSPDERAELVKLTTEDIKDVPRDQLNFMLGYYPDNTTTIHPISIKKDSDES